MFENKNITLFDFFFIIDLHLNIKLQKNILVLNSQAWKLIL